MWEKNKTTYWQIDSNAKWDIKYRPDIQARASSLDTYLTCPMKSQLPNDMDEFTSYIGKILHYSHQHPEATKWIIDLFMTDYKDVVGTSNNELRDMLNRYVKRWEEFLEETKDFKLYYEAPLSTHIKGIRMNGHPDIMIDLEDIAEVIDFKSSVSPWSFNWILDIKELSDIKKAQPYIYCYLACLVLKKQKAKFTYYVYSKWKTTKLTKHSVEFEFDELEKIVFYIIDKYQTALDLDIREPKNNDLCWSCQLWPKKWKSCPIWKVDWNFNF